MIVGDFRKDWDSHNGKMDFVRTASIPELYMVFQAGITVVHLN